MIDRVVDAEETVVGFVELLHVDGLVLSVVLRKVEWQLSLYFSSELSTLDLFVKMEYSKKGGRLTSFLFI